jgi:hypothetical protein
MIQIGVRSRHSNLLMYSPTGFPKKMYWLLAAAIAIQPVAGFPCTCNAHGTNAAKRPAEQRHGFCCCCGSIRDHKTGSKPQRTCCQNSLDRENDPSNACVCKCRSDAPAAPPLVPAQRNHTDDLATPALYVCTGTINSPTLHQQDWDFSLPTAFASAAEHCTMLCRLLL